MTETDLPEDRSQDPAADVRLYELRDRFRAVLPDRIAGIGAQLSSLGHGAWPDDVVEPLITEVHSLAGSSGLFGFPQVGAAAAALEQLILTSRAQAPNPTLADVAPLRIAHRRLEAAMRGEGGL